jgi:hypothetical protein
MKTAAELEGREPAYRTGYYDGYYSRERYVDGILPHVRVTYEMGVDDGVRDRRQDFRHLQQDMGLYIGLDRAA